MKARLIILTGLAALALAGCETSQPTAQSVPLAPPEQTIQSPAGKVRSAAIKTMSDRGYHLTPVGNDTLLFDRIAGLGSSAKFGILHSKDAWRRVRMRLIPSGASTRVTAEPGLVINRGTAFEQEEPDNSGGARQNMHDILAKIQTEAQATP